MLLLNVFKIENHSNTIKNIGIISAAIATTYTIYKVFEKDNTYNNYTNPLNKKDIKNEVYIYDEKYQEHIKNYTNKDIIKDIKTIENEVYIYDKKYQQDIKNYTNFMKNFINAIDNNLITEDLVNDFNKFYKIDKLNKDSHHPYYYLSYVFLNHEKIPDKDNKKLEFYALLGINICLSTQKLIINLMKNNIVQVNNNKLCLVRK